VSGVRAADLAPHEILSSHALRMNRFLINAISVVRFQFFEFQNSDFEFTSVGLVFQPGVENLLSSTQIQSITLRFYSWVPSGIGAR
jgi:hypothetical protein